MSSSEFEHAMTMDAQYLPTVEALYQDYFARQVEARPDAIGVCSPGISLTYAELDALSSSLANFLIGQGVGPNEVVPLCFENSPWAVISMLSVVKAGGAFTFLDATYPRSRLEDVVRNVGAKFLLVSPSLAGSSCLKDLLPTSFIISGDSIHNLPASSEVFPTPPNTLTSPESLLYIIFTSGSTGKPKGVCIPHSSYLSSALHQRSVCNLVPNSRVLQFAKYTFDISILETLTTLISGGCICIPDEEARGRGLEHVMNDFQITWSVMTVSLSRVIDPVEVPSLKTLLLGGEPLAQTDLKRWAGHVQLMNAYGPTEASILAAVNPTVNADACAANIGWPVGGQLWVVDADDANRLVPAGRTGELAIEGPSLANGYLNDEARTSLAFVQDLEWMKDFQGERKRRAYLTGDLVQQCETDGSIIFVGRKDTQVKVRGFRIELGDVESNLAQDELVHSVAAFAPTRGACQGRLVGVVVLASHNASQSSGDPGVIKVLDPSLWEARNAVSTLEDNLSRRVQSYMIPNTWFVLESFPLTRHDKIDRAQVKTWLDELHLEALRAYECIPSGQNGESPGIERSHIANGTAKGISTDSLRALIAQVLNLPLSSVDTNKSFVNLGGDSISAMLLMSRCKSQSLSIRVRDVLRSKSLSELSRCVDKVITAPEAAKIGDLVGEPFGLTPIQQYYFQREPEGDLVGGANRFNQSFILRLTRLYPADAVAAAVRAVVQRHSMLRCRFFKSKAGFWQQSILPSNDANSSHLFQEYTVSSEKEVDQAVLRSQCAVHMVHGPVFVASLINLPGGGHQLLSLIAHHAVVDLMSWRVITQDLEELIDHGAVQTHREMSLPFQAWYKLQHEYAKSHLAPEKTLHHDVQPADFAYWGMGERPNLFMDTERYTFQLDKVTTSVLMSNESHWPLRTDPVDVFLACVIHSLANVFKDRALPTVFREAHGREPWSDSIDISSSVGWFTAMYPIHFESAAFTDSIVETIRRVKDAQRSVPQNGWPYFASRFNHADGIERFRHHGVPEITFDYLGLYQNLEREGSLFQLDRRVDQDVGPAFNRFSLVEITAEVLRGQMQLTFEFNKFMRHQDRLQQWFKDCERCLRRAAVELPALVVPKFTMSDFPLLQTSYDGLDALLGTTLPDIGVVTENVEDIYGTSPMQTGLLLSQEKDADLYQSSMVFRVRPVSKSGSARTVDVQRIKDAWKAVVERHTSLRTIFLPDSAMSAGRDAFNQVVLKSVDASIVQIQASSANEVSQVLYGPLRLSPRGIKPAHRFTICTALTGETYVRLDINHALFDASSTHILVRDLLAVYASFELPKAPMYRDFITHIQICDLEKSLEYWNGYLAAVEPSCLPTLIDGTRIDYDTYQTVHLEHGFNIQALGKFCQEHGITLPTLIKAAWAMVLGAYNGTENVCFGYVVSGRDLPIEDIDNAVGVFINILVCRVDLGGSLGAVLDGIHTDTQTALQHQHCSLAHIQRQSNQFTSSTSSKPLFNSVINFQVQKTAVAGESCDLPIAFEMTHCEDPNEFAVCVDAVARGGSLEMSLMYRTSALSSGQAKNVASALKAACNTILSTMAENPTAKTSRLHFLDPTQEAQLWGWNACVPSPVLLRIHDVISLQASSRPEALAIESWDGSVTYGQLDDMSSKLCYHLIHMGVQSGSIVLLCFEKSLYTIVALMAVLKAGGAFVLLDPQHLPMDRTRGLILDTDAKVLLSDKLGSKLLSGEVATTLVVDSHNIQRLSNLPCCPDSTLQLAADEHRPSSPSDPAYIIFTSGTTGKPKGIVTSHSAFSTAAFSYSSKSGLSHSTRALQWSSYTFDACLIEMISCLMFGGCVCVPSEKQRRDDITGAILDFRVNWLGLTPSVSRLIEPQDVSEQLKTLWLMGEAMSKSDVRRWRDHVKLLNAYGPSECSAAVAWHDHVVEEDPTNIGCTVGAVGWIVHPDDSDQLMPIGTMGELILEGFTLADGYLNDHDRTAEAFIKPPKWLVEKRTDDQLTTVLYKTGDMCRYNSDGTICFVGRKDNQVKVNGQRIEPSETEHHLLTRSSNFMDGVAVEVIKPAARQYRQTLVAFFTCTTQQQERLHVAGASGAVVLLDLTEDMAERLMSLQDAISDSLPPFMIPKVFIPLAAFPRAPSGKLDHKVLRATAEQLPAERLDAYGLLKRSRKSPISEMERRLQAAWAAALNISSSSIDVDTSFFRVGGDSLSAIRLVSLARKNFDLGLSVAHVLRHPRLCDMAKIAEELNHSQPRDAAVAEPFIILTEDNDSANRDEVLQAVAEQCGVPTGDVMDVYPCSPLQEATVASTMIKRGAYVHQHVLRLPDSIDESRFMHAWEQVTQNNPIMRTRIVNIEICGTVQAVLSESVSWAKPTCSLQEYLADDIAVPLSWGKPLSRHAIFRPQNPDGHTFTYFIWTAHHALYDGWSEGLMFEQLEHAYLGNSLPELVPYSHYIRLLRSTRSDDAACSAFWGEQLSGEPATTFPLLPSRTYTPKPNRHVVRDFTINDTVGTSTLATASTSEISVTTIIRAAWALTVARYANAEDIVFGTTLSGRNAPIPNITRVNGPTIITVPVKVHIDRSRSISRFLEDVQSQAISMIPFEHWGLRNIGQVSPPANAEFQNLLVVQPGELRRQQLPLGLEMVNSEQDEDFHTYPLIVECVLTGQGRVQLKMAYDGNVLPHGPRMAAHFEHLCRQLADPTMDESVINDLDFCTPEDKRLVFEWNREDPVIVDDTIHNRVSANAKTRPDAQAVRSWDDSFSYAELDELSSTLARYLVGMGTLSSSSEAVIPAVFEKSAWAVVAQLAILKAGGVLCMLDPAHPTQRLDYIVETVEAKLILASKTYVNLLPPNTGRAVVEVSPSSIRSMAQSQNARTLSPSSTPKKKSSLPNLCSSHAAYIVFTSGTSGKPKGSVTEHSAYVTASASLARSTRITASSRMLQYAAYAFDAFILETFTPLMEGGCICIPQDAIRTNPTALGSTIRDFGVTHALLTPSVARLLTKDAMPSIQTLILGGEAMAPSDRFWSEHVQLVNAYGPSECSVCSVIHHNITLETEHLAIGNMVSGRCWIVEPHNHHLLAPVGCVGELLLESPGLARGYLKEPAKTDEAFIASPSWLRGTRLQSRLYKTGDLVRYDPENGTLLYVGRKDMQVKLHGQRLELAEIEHHISIHSQVESVVVTIPKAGNWKGKLVAALSLRKSSLGTDSVPQTGEIDMKLIDSAERTIASRHLQEIRNHLEKEVPSYMIPTVWATVQGIPLTLSRKIDKRKVTLWLEAVGNETYRDIIDLCSSFEDSEPKREPASDMEKRLQRIIARVLNIPVEDVLLNRSFIALGGDSIAAMEATARCGSDNVSVTVKDILQSKTIAQLAERAVDLRGEDQSSKQPKLEEEPEATFFSLTPIQKFYFDAGLGPESTASPNLSPRSAHFNQSFFLEFQRKVPVEKVSQAIHAIVAQHSMLRARFEIVNGEWSQFIEPDSSTGRWEFHHHQLQCMLDILPIVAASQRRMNAKDGVMFSANLFSVSEGVQDHQRQMMFLVAHHLVVDLVSWRIILHDLEELLSHGHLFTQQPISFQTWAKQQEKYAIMEFKPDQLIAKFGLHSPESPGIKNLWGVDQQNNLFGDAVASTFTLGAETTAALLGRCNNSFSTEPTDLFIAGLLESFASVFEDRGVPAVYCEGHGREPWDGSGINLSGTVGWFTTIYPIHVHLGRDRGVINESIRRVKDARRRLSARDGWSYFTSRALSKSSTESQAQWPMELIFNYKGLYQQLERADALLREASLPGASLSMNGPLISETSDIGSRCPRMAIFDVSVQISEGKASFTLIYNRHMRQITRIHQWMTNYEGLLKTTARELSTTTIREPTLADFPLLPTLNYPALDRLKFETLPALGLTSFDQVYDIFPCAPTQQGILISQSRVASSYMTSVVFTVCHQNSGLPDLDRLMTAWKKVVARHSALRTIFIDSDDDGYSQLVLREWVPHMLQLEYNLLQDKDDDVLERMANFPAATCDQTKPSHQAIFCQTANRIYVKLEISHALIDGTSLGILLQDLSSAYDDKLSLNESDLPLYKDYVRYIQSLPMDISVAYWDQYLKNLRPCCFPILRDDHDQVVQTADADAVASIDISFDNDARSITEFCRSHALTHASLFQVAWALVLRNYVGSSTSSSSDPSVCFGYLSSGRDVPVPRIGEIVGAVCNMLVFKMDLDVGSKKLSMFELIQRAQDDWTASLQHQFVPLADIQHRHEGKTLFNTSMSYRSQGRVKSPGTQASSANDLSLEPVSGYDPSEFDVVLNIVAGPSGFQATFSYRLSCMTASQAENAAFAFNLAVKKIIKNGSQKLQDFVLMTDYDLARAPAAPLHACGILVPENKLCDMVISHTASLQPSAQAICSWDGALTYHELETLSSHLAAHLTSLGIGPGLLVPVCMEKSLWAIVVFIGILKAGGAFVPMDAMQPGRWRTIVEQTKAEVVIASEERKHDMAALCDSVVVINKKTMKHFVQKEGPDSGSKIQQQTKRSPSDPAYVIFTSGSTGTPKGVVVSHGAWCSSSLGIQKAWFVDAQTRFLQFASYGFDATIGETLMVLMAGGCVCSPSETERLDDFEDVVRSMAVNAAFLVPSFARALNPENMPSLQTVIMGGEPVLEEDIRRWGNRSRLLTGYGPTECSVVCSGMQLLPGVTRSSVIGRPYMCKYWVVDPMDYQVLLPLGAVGELLIEGPVLARGYLNNPDKTSAAFVENPSWAERQGNETRRFYRAGDLVQLNLNDGSYRCQGRIDAQVKVNGQRIEIHEVEVHLERALGSSYPVVVETLYKQDNHEAKLIAFIALGEKYTHDDRQGRTGSGAMINEATKQAFRAILAGVRERMGKTVPSYMIPSFFVPLSTVPLLSSGKADRQQLRKIAGAVPPAELSILSEAATKPASASATTSSPTAYHHTQLQARMSQLWASVLGVDVALVRPDLSFFSQGGDSVLAIKLVSVCRAAGLSFSVSQILRNPTLEAMCKLPGPKAAARAPNLQKSLSENKTDALLSPFPTPDKAKLVKDIVCVQLQITPNNVADILEATHTQVSFVTTGLLEGRGNTNYMLFELTGQVDPARVETTCQQLVARHPILRTVFIAHQRCLWQVVLDKMAVNFTTYRCGKWRQGHLANKLIKADQAKPVSLGQQYIRFIYLDGQKSGGLLILRISHAQYDGMSIPVLFEDLCALYENQDDGDHDRIVPVRPIFSDFARASRNSNAQGAEDYWRTFLKGSHMTNVVAHTSPPHGRCKVTTLTSEIAVADATNFTFANIAKASWALVLAEVSASTDVVFGHLISGRNMCLPDGKGDINEVLGPCINMIPVRVRVNDSGGQDILHQVYDQQLACIPYETFGLDQIVERCTDWPLWTRFSSIVQHQNLNGIEELMASDAGFRFGDASCRFGAVQGEPDMFDILVMTSPLPTHEVARGPVSRSPPQNRIGVKFLFNETVLRPDLVAHLMERFVANVELLSTGNYQQMDKSVQLFSDLTSAGSPKIQPMIPVLARNYIDEGKPMDRTSVALASGFKFEEMVPEIQMLVRHAWDSVALSPRAATKFEAEFESGYDHTTVAFYNIWGSLIAAAQLADFYSQNGRLQVSIEDVIEHPSMLAQTLLLAERMNNTGRSIWKRSLFSRWTRGKGTTKMSQKGTKAVVEKVLQKRKISRRVTVKAVNVS